MAALMCDVIDGRVTASATNAACNAGAKLLKNAELELKYATVSGTGIDKHLKLADG